MKRREFHRVAGAASTLLLSYPLVAKPFAADSRDHDHLSISQSIQANFGPCFHVRSWSIEQGAAVAEIEHLGNRYQVKSDDLDDWSIERSTIQ